MEYRYIGYRCGGVYIGGGGGGGHDIGGGYIKEGGEGGEGRGRSTGVKYSRTDQVCVGSRFATQQTLRHYATGSP